MAPVAGDTTGIPDVMMATTMMDEAPMSRTHQYRKVMKPLLERKRRARINNCLDELKDLMVEALQAEGESITKLEKADVLELTVRHLQKLRRQQMLQSNPSIDVDRYRAGFTACASEVGLFMSSVPGVNVNFGKGLMSHLGLRINQISGPIQGQHPQTTPLSPPAAMVARPQLPLSPVSDGGYNSGRESTPSPPLSVGSPSPPPPSAPLGDNAHPHHRPSPVWRPF